MPRTAMDSGRSRHAARSRGQVVVIFAMSIFLFVALTAVVVDIAFYWVSTLKVQRAADAAALAGAVYLPGDTDTAYSEALKSATENGFTVGGPLTITPVQDANDPRQLDVTVTTSVPTFFARVIGISSWPVTRTAKGVYVLPVPMGSPLAYYGVGDFWTNPTMGVPSAASPATWANPTWGWLTGASYATSTTNNQVQQYATFNFGSVASPIGAFVTFHAKVSGSGTCQVKAEVSWDNGATWGNTSITTANLTTTDTAYTLGGKGSAWGSNHSTWSSNDFLSTKFKIRLTYLKGSGCGTLSVNTITGIAYAPTLSVTTDGATVLASQGGWGAIITRGGSEQNGDAYGPENNAGTPYSGANGLYDARGYDYAVQLPSGGVVKVFDPGFCAMGGNPSGAGNLGAGDHWIAGNTNPVSTYFTLWNTNGKLGLRGTWTSVYTSGTMFKNQTASDTTNLGPATSNGTATTMTGCDANHNSWWTIPTGNLAGGTYVLEVATTDPADATINASTNAENMFAIEAVGPGAPALYGNGRMAVYNNLQPGAAKQLFYLAKIDRATGAGKTALIDIFDPGDVPGGAVLKVLAPDGAGGTQRQATFSYTTDANCNATVNSTSGGGPYPPSDFCSGGAGTTQIQTSLNGHSSFNNTWIHIAVPMASTYGSDPMGLWAPPSKPTDKGWWQIQYETPGGGNDTTTWQVSVSGNPVHLLVP